MLSQLLADHVALHQALGLKFRTQGSLLRNFVAFAESRSEHVVTTATVQEWALQASSPEQRRNRLLTVRRFARARLMPKIRAMKFPPPISSAVPAASGARLTSTVPVISNG
ncbi:hypothetical protein [Leisingera aquimarina]|uniref:hypothetical protein n=1 Tax=Leisingera aquimarina TaxID=476529 RepID=UPI00040F5D96|nr:hypothetical protein [Leisingera aquimarina]